MERFAPTSLQDNVFPIEVPPLRGAQHDVLMLLEYFIHRIRPESRQDFGKIDKRTPRIFRSYDWPGNISRVADVVERSVIVSSDGVFRIDEAWLSRDFRQCRCDIERLKTTEGSFEP